MVCGYVLICFLFHLLFIPELCCPVCLVSHKLINFGMQRNKPKPDFIWRNLHQNPLKLMGDFSLVYFGFGDTNGHVPPVCCTALLSLPHDTRWGVYYFSLHKKKNDNLQLA